MSQIVFLVEPESRLGNRWHIKRSGSVRATYNSRAQAVMDARQLASFENELRGRAAIVRVLDADHPVRPARLALPSARPGSAKFVVR
jgi:hypothetical protein